LTLRPDQVPSALPEITRANSNQHSRRHPALSLVVLSCTKRLGGNLGGNFEAGDPV
jgi:hypothetical protein